MLIVLKTAGHGNNRVIIKKIKKRDNVDTTETRLSNWTELNWTETTVSSVHGILQAEILEWVAISSLRGSSQPRDQTGTSKISRIAGGFFTLYCMIIKVGFWYYFKPRGLLT